MPNIRQPSAIDVRKLNGEEDDGNDDDEESLRLSVNDMRSTHSYDWNKDNNDTTLSKETQLHCDGN
jgi:hypothetical protein